MPNLERRVCALEKASPTSEEITILRRIVSPGQPDGEIHSLRDGDGKLWTRLPGETEQEQIDRATLAVRRNEWGAALLFGSPL